MYLSQTFEYAIRVMAQLALMPPRQNFSREELASKTHVPVHFLAKILRQLVKAELIKSRRGNSGGFALVRPMKEIRLLDIANAIGYDIEIKHCGFGWKQCHNNSPCPLHHTWAQLKEFHKKWLYDNTLADIKDFTEKSYHLQSFI